MQALGQYSGATIHRQNGVYVGRSDGPKRRRRRPIIGQTSHKRCGMFDIRLSPVLSVSERISISWHRDQLIIDQQSIVTGHEFQIARPPRRDYRLAQTHAFGQPQTQPFGSMKRHIGIAAGLERVNMGNRQHIVADEDARIFAGERHKMSQASRIKMAAARFDKQRNIFPLRGKRPLECSNRSGGILALNR